MVLSLTLCRAQLNLFPDHVTFSFSGYRVFEAQIVGIFYHYASHRTWRLLLSLKYNNNYKYHSNYKYSNN